MSTILLILSCKKYSKKAEFQRQSWIPCLPLSIRAYHVIGDEERCTAQSVLYEVDETNHIIYTCTKDDYLSLPHKVIVALQAVHDTMSYDYLYKTDDDQIVTDLSFFDEVEHLRKGHSYGGHVLTVEGHLSSYWAFHPELPRDLWMEPTTYCTGRFYFLSHDAVAALLPQREWFRGRMIEDHSIGLALPAHIKGTPLALNDRIKHSIVDMDNSYVDQVMFIYTECVNCPEIGLNALLSYQLHHSYAVHVYLTQSDLAYLLRHASRLDLSRIRWTLVSPDLIDIYQRDGHLATAMLWESVIRSVQGKKIIHFDSDVIFRSNAIDSIVAGLYAHSLVGSARCYRCNLNGRDDIRHQPDVVSTYCFGYDPSFIHKDLFTSDQLIQMIRGSYTSLPYSILDFFDPVSYLILHYGGKMKTIPFTVLGGLNSEGSKENGYPLNSRMDCGDTIIHFSSVGSGITFEKAIKQGKSIQVPDTYVQHSLTTVAIYRYMLFGIESPRLPEWVTTLRPVFQELHSIEFVPIDS